MSEEFATFLTLSLKLDLCQRESCTGFFGMIPCVLVGRYRPFGGLYCLCLHFLPEHGGRSLFRLFRSSATRDC